MGEPATRWTGDCRRGKQQFGAGSAADVASSNRDVFVDHVSIAQRFREKLVKGTLLGNRHLNDKRN